MEYTIVLYPSPGIGHLIPMVELGNAILKHHPCFSISIIITTVPYATGSTAPYIASVSAATPSIAFHHLPAICPPVPPSFSTIPLLNFQIPRLNNHNLHQTLVSISQSSVIKAVVLDFFCSAAMEVSKLLSLPTYYFFSSGAYGLSLFLYAPVMDATNTESLKDMNKKINDIPCLPPVHSSDVPDLMLDRTLEVYELFMESSKSMQDASGIIVNTFKGFEGKAIDNIIAPPMFCVGPLLSTTRDDEKHECLNWLDSQPSGSVLFLCFGSLGLFSEEQLKEIARGLESCGVRFLWVVRSPPEKIGLELELKSVLPSGFSERTKDRGCVVKDWAPQVAVLSHKSVGGFVTHCGWNSILESVSAGVPMLAWPLYAEQKLNRVIMVEELGVALNVNVLENGFVTAFELEERVEELMRSEKGKEIKNRVMAFRDGAKVAMSDGGSSRDDLAKFIGILKQT